MLPCLQHTAWSLPAACTLLPTTCPCPLQSSFIKRLTSLGHEGQPDGLPHSHHGYIEAGWVAEDDHEVRLAAGSVLNTGKTDVSSKSGNTTAGEGQGRGRGWRASTMPHVMASVLPGVTSICAAGAV